MRGRAVALGICMSMAAIAAPPAQATSSKQIIAFVNKQRRDAGIPPVVESKALSRGCANHLRYLHLNPRTRNPHDETPGKPGFTRSGRKAARTSVLGGGAPGSWTKFNAFEEAPYHLYEILDPGLKTTGAAELVIHDGPVVITSECLNTLAAPRRAPPRKPRLYVYPGPNSRVPIRQVFREGRPAAGVQPGRTTGPWIYGWVLGKRGARVRLTHLTIRFKEGPALRLRRLVTTGRGGLVDRRRRTTRSPRAALSRQSDSFYTPDAGGFGVAARSPSDAIMERWRKHSQELAEMWRRKAEEARRAGDTAGAKAAEALQRGWEDNAKGVDENQGEFDIDEEYEQAADL